MLSCLIDSFAVLQLFLSLNNESLWLQIRFSHQFWLPMLHNLFRRNYNIICVIAYYIALMTRTAW